MSRESLQAVVPAKKRKLTFKELAFIDEFVKDFNGTQAAIRARYSPKTAYSIASELLRKPEIEGRIKTLIGVERFRDLAELSKLSKSDNRKLFRPNGTLKAPSEWDDATAAAVASLEVEEIFTGQGKNRVWTGYLKKVKLWNKPESLKTELTHLHQLDERITFPGKDGEPQELSGMSDGDLHRQLVLIICRITGQEIPKEIEVEGRAVDPPSGMITDGGRPESKANGGSAQELIDEILNKQKKDKGNGSE